MSTPTTLPSVLAASRPPVRPPTAVEPVDDHPLHEREARAHQQHRRADQQHGEKDREEQDRTTVDRVVAGCEPVAVEPVTEAVLEAHPREHPHQDRERRERGDADAELEPQEHPTGSGDPVRMSSPDGDTDGEGDQEQREHRGERVRVGTPGGSDESEEDLLEPERQRTAGGVDPVPGGHRAVPDSAVHHRHFGRALPRRSPLGTLEIVHAARQ